MYYNGERAARVRWRWEGKYEGDLTKYIITDQGNVYNSETGLRLKHKTDRKGYATVILSHHNNQKTVRVHHEVAIYFVNNPKPEEYHIVHHKDENKMNPVYTNLEWTNHKKNLEYSMLSGTWHPAKGDLSGRKVLNSKKVKKICKKLASGNYTVYDIAKEYKVHPQVIKEIYYRNNWVDISKDYDFSKYRHPKRKRPIDDETVLNIAHDLNKYISMKKIAKKYNVSNKQVYDIYKKNYYSDVTEGIIFPVVIL